MTVSRERATMLAVWSLAALACLLGAIEPPGAGSHTGTGGQLLDLVRVFSTAASRSRSCSVPGSSGGPSASAASASPSCRCRGWDCWSSPPASPGFSRTASTRAWSASPSSPPRWGCCSAACSAAAPRTCSTREEQRALLIVGLALGLAIGRALWSLGPAGELYEGTISRTLFPRAGPTAASPS